MRRHSTSSYNATNILTRVLGVSTGGAPLDRSSIQVRSWWYRCLILGLPLPPR